MMIPPLFPAAVAVIGTALASLALPTIVRAADHAVLGARLLVKNPGTAAARKITVTAKERGTDDSIVGNPVASGATLTVTASGASPSSQAYDLPAGTISSTGKPSWRGDALAGFRYRDTKGEHGAVKMVQLKRRGAVFTLKVAISGRHGAVSVVPPNPGASGCVLLAITGGDSYSVRFASGNVANDGATLFKVSEPTAAGSCVTTTSTSTTTTSSSTTLPVPCGTTTFPTCGGMCPAGFVCEGVESEVNTDIPSFCGGNICTTPPVTSCTCVAVTDTCAGSCSSYCPMTYSLTPGGCGVGKHCALRIDYYCFVAGGSCLAGCVDD